MDYYNHTVYMNLNIILVQMLTTEFFNFNMSLSCEIQNIEK